MAENDNHHIIQKAYLEKFAIDNDPRRIVSIKINNIQNEWDGKLSTPYIKKNSENEFQYYEVEDAPFLSILLGSEPDKKYIEKDINQSFENNFSRLWDGLTMSSSDFTFDNRYDLIRLIYHYKLRCTKVRDSINLDVIKNDINQYLYDVLTKDRTVSSQEFDGLADQLERITKARDETNQRDLHNSLISTNHSTPSPESEINILRLVESEWVLLCTNKDKEFITSDNPGFSFDGNSWNLLPDNNNSFDFYFPLTPLFCLNIRCSPGRNVRNIVRINVVNLNEEKVDWINHGMGSTCNLRIYSNNKKNLENLVKKYKLGIYSDDYLTPPN